MKPIRGLFAVSFAAIFVATSCKSPNTAAVRDADEPEGDEAGDTSEAARAASNVLGLPTLVSPDKLLATANEVLRKAKASPEAIAVAAPRLAHYFGFLGLSPEEAAKAGDTVSRLMGSSTQFLLCDDFRDADCLEKKPDLEPTKKFRKEAAADLGKAVLVAGKPQIETFFTDQFDVPLDQFDASKSLASKLGARIKKDGTKGVSIAMYGIDDLSGSLSPVFNALTEKAKQRVPIRAVIDNQDINKKADRSKLPLVYSYIKPPTKQRPWVLDEFADGETFMAFQYAESPLFINTFNAGIASDDDAVVRMEAPPTEKIMHNKFVVLQGAGGQASVWTGTANIANTCMGTERNTNMAVYVSNKEIAQEYQREFEQMWTYQGDALDDKDYVPRKVKQPIKMGLFHNAKVPVTKRLFRFADGTDIHLHFSPTDDTEHRVILPLILGATPGEKLRISMFAGVGFELMRAMQAALARGVDIDLLFDQGEGRQAASWLNDEGGLLGANPYGKKPLGKLTARFSTWKMNHQKAASLTEANGHVETFIIGSQNWTSPGNDENDENTITLHNAKAQIQAGVDFNNFFDKRMMPKAKPATPRGASLTDDLDQIPPTKAEAGEMLQETKPSDIDWSTVE